MPGGDAVAVANQDRPIGGTERPGQRQKQATCNKNHAPNVHVYSVAARRGRIRRQRSDDRPFTLRVTGERIDSSQGREKVDPERRAARGDSAGNLAGHSGGAVCGHRGRERQRQEHAAGSACRARYAQRRRDLARRRAHPQSGGNGAGRGARAQNRLCLSVLPTHPNAHRSRKCAAALRTQRGGQRPGAGAPPARRSWPGGAHGSLSRAALRRRAAARGAGARLCGRAARS